MEEIQTKDYNSRNEKMGVKLSIYVIGGKEYIRVDYALASFKMWTMPEFTKMLQKAPNSVGSVV